MQVLSSLKTAKTRHPGCKVVRRHGVVYVICKENPRFKARQGGKKKRYKIIIILCVNIERMLTLSSEGIQAVGGFFILVESRLSLANFMT